LVLDFLGAGTVGTDSELPRNQEVARVSRRYFDGLAHLTEIDHVFTQDNIHGVILHNPQSGSPFVVATFFAFAPRGDVDIKAFAEIYPRIEQTGRDQNHAGLQ